MLLISFIRSASYEALPNHPDVQDLITSLLHRSRGTRENVVDDLFRLLDEARKLYPGVPTLRKKLDAHPFVEQVMGHIACSGEVRFRI